MESTEHIASKDSSLRIELIEELRSLRLTYGDRESDRKILDITNSWFVESGDRYDAVEDSALENRRTYPLPSPCITWTERSDSRGLLIEYVLEAGDAATFLVRASNMGKKPVTLLWRQQILGLPLQGKLFAPSGQDFYDMTEQGVTVAYRDRGELLSIPLATVFDEKSNVGFTVVADIGMPVPPFRFQVLPEKGIVLVDRKMFDLQPAQARTIRHYIIRHQGCWRPGLAWLRGTFARFFMLPDDILKDTYGCFAYGNIADADLCRRLAQEGVRNFEIHFTYSHLGKYLPDEEAWIPAIDDKWNAVKRTIDPTAPREDASYEDIKGYMNKVVKASCNVSRVRQFIQDLKCLGIRTYIYFQPTESWEFFANTHFPESIRRNPDGSPVLTWYDHVVVNCSPETRWGQYLCTQLEGLLEIYPEVDGIFMDQAAGDRNDYSVCRITDKLARIASERGKWCYWNGPYMVELMEHAVGMLAEGGSIQAEQIKFLTIGNKVCCGMGRTERQYQRNLINGLWPSAPSLANLDRFRYSDEAARVSPVPEDLQSLHRRYMYLYELYPGKVWVLEPHALETPAGVQGNIFERPNGEYLVPLILPSRSSSDGNFKRDIEVIVRVSGASQVRAVYLRTPDLEGQQFLVPWSREGNAIRIKVPWLRSACLLWLACEEQRENSMPSPPQPIRVQKGPTSPVMIAYFSLEGFIPTGSLIGVDGGLATTAPLPPIPIRKVWLNGHRVGPLNSRNHRSWHRLITISLPDDILDYLRQENELVIEPDGPRDFLKLRNLQMTVMLSDGRLIRSGLVTETYSSCQHPLAEGIVGSPIRIKFRVPSATSKI